MDPTLSTQATPPRVWLPSTRRYLHSTASLVLILWPGCKADSSAIDTVGDTTPSPTASVPSPTTTPPQPPYPTWYPDREPWYVLRDIQVPSDGNTTSIRGVVTLHYAMDSVLDEIKLRLSPLLMDTFMETCRAETGCTQEELDYFASLIALMDEYLSLEKMEEGLQNALYSGQAPLYLHLAHSSTVWLLETSTFPPSDDYHQLYADGIEEANGADSLVLRTGRNLTGQLQMSPYPTGILKEFFILWSSGLQWIEWPTNVSKEEPLPLTIAARVDVEHFMWATIGISSCQVVNVTGPPTDPCQDYWDMLHEVSEQVFEDDVDGNGDPETVEMGIDLTLEPL